MHTLTKVFIVLWALISVFTMALAVPLVTNNNTWKTKYQDADANRMAAEAQATRAAKDLELANTAKNQSDSANKKMILDLQEQLSGKVTETADLRAQLESARQDKDTIVTQLNTLSAAAETNANIIKTQADEITHRREESLKLEKQQIELQDQLRDVMSKLNNSLDAQRILQEQIAQLQDQLKVAKSGGEATVKAPGQVVHPVSPRIVGRVTSVTKGTDGTNYIEINLGSRDGVAANMKFMLDHDGKFMGNLIITTVDLNRSVGKVELQQGDILVSDRVVGGL